MMRRCAVPVVLLLAVSPAWASYTVFTVTNANDSGAGSLRQAIESANFDPGTDIITFGEKMNGAKIHPLTPLPRITGPVILSGDIDHNNDPDVSINCSSLTEGCGLTVEADGCTIDGLAVTFAPSHGLYLRRVDGCIVRNCHLGVNLAGNRLAANGYAGLYVLGGHANIIGQPGKRNVIGTGTGPEEYWNPCVLIDVSSGNVVQDNYIGVNRAGTAILGDGGRGTGVRIEGGGTDMFPEKSVNNVVRRNVFAGLWKGVYLGVASRNRIEGNYFGLGPDGDSPLQLSSGVESYSRSDSNQIGGTSSAKRNVFAGSAQGVRIAGVGNRVEGNYFGLNAAGTAARELTRGVYDEGEGSIIGGSTAAAGNHFCGRAAWSTCSVLLEYRWPTVQNNRFNVLPAGADPGDRAAEHIVVRYGTGVRIVGNVITRAEAGIRLGDNATGIGRSAGAEVSGNTFRDCTAAIRLERGVTARLGNLGNSSTDDDGGNVFEPTNTWHVYNTTADKVRAEGNSWGTTVRRQIEAKVWDRRDDPALGRVDFIPLAGGVLPTGDAGAAPLIVAAATAVPSATGAQIAFSLSAPAAVTVTVLNTAGRPVATVLSDRVAEPGVQRVLWNGQAASGTPVPAGRYLVRVLARSADGATSSALASVMLH